MNEDVHSCKDVTNRTEDSTMPFRIDEGVALCFSKSDFLWKDPDKLKLLWMFVYFCHIHPPSEEITTTKFALLTLNVRCFPCEARLLAWGNCHFAGCSVSRTR